MIKPRGIRKYLRDIWCFFKHNINSFTTDINDEENAERTFGGLRHDNNGYIISCFEI